MAEGVSRKPVLINPTWEQMVERDPLIAFSFYLDGRKSVLIAVANEVVENLDGGFSGPAVDGGRITRADDLMWLWTLGAYEVIRTMCQAKECFAESVRRELGSLKLELAAARMPAAKMERARTSTPVPSSRSSSGWDVANRDLLVGDPTSTTISARRLLSRFQQVVSSIRPSDILKPHEDSYRKKA